VSIHSKEEMMNAPSKSLLLVLGAVSLGGFVALRTAHAGPSTVDPSGANADSTGSIEVVEKHDGGHIELAEKHDGGGHIELAAKADGGGWVALSEKKEGGSVELAVEKKDGGSASIELAAKGDGGGWVTSSLVTH